LAALPAGAGDPKASDKKDSEPPAPKAAKSKELSEEQKQALKDAGLDF
jgi:hypothetical protein